MVAYFKCKHANDKKNHIRKNLLLDEGQEVIFQ